MTDEGREWIDADLSPEADDALWQWQGSLRIDQTHDADRSNLEADCDVEHDRP